MAVSPELLEKVRHPLEYASNAEDLDKTIKGLVRYRIPVDADQYVMVRILWPFCHPPYHQFEAGRHNSGSKDGIDSSRGVNQRPKLSQCSFEVLRLCNQAQ